MVVRANVAKSLLTLFDQVEVAFPGRAKGNDGTIGDANHQATDSDHNATSGDGVITALDITHDPAHGFDADQFAETLRLNRDQRIKYVIRSGRIFSSTNSPWTWRARNKGPGDHTEHVHISVGRGPDGHTTNPELYDDPSPWAIRALPGTIPAPVASGGRRFTNIKATVFNDGIRPGTETAYTFPMPADFMGYSLPGRIVGDLLLRITNRATGLSAIAHKADIGPWYDGASRGPEDRWWENGTRPRAETDPRTNGAGIDLYPALARAIGIQVVVGIEDGRIVAGEAQVDVEIISETPPMAETSNVERLLTALATQQMALIERIDALTRVLQFGKEAGDPPVVPKPVDPPKTETKPPPPIVITTPAPPIIEPLDLKTLILSGIAAIALPATGVTETMATPTFGSLLPVILGAAGGGGLPSLLWTLLKGKLGVKT